MPINNLVLDKSKILVSGSIVIDSIFELRGKIKDSITIENGMLGKQNLMFTALEKEEYFGGTGGNICYGLGKLGNKPLLASVVGKDFTLYKSHLKRLGVELRVYEDKERYNATFYVMTDESKEQVGIFQPNAYGKHIENIPLSRLLKSDDFKNIKVAIFSPGTGKSIVNNIVEFRKKGPKDAFVIFDPGQVLSFSFSEALLSTAFSKSDLLILNDSELSILKNQYGFDIPKIFSQGIKYIIETRGADGSVLYEMNGGEKKETNVSTPKIKKVVDPTGAGDAFRAGLISAIIDGKSIDLGMKLGAKLGAECVKYQGGQTYK